VGSALFAGADFFYMVRLALLLAGLLCASLGSYLHSRGQHRSSIDRPQLPRPSIVRVTARAVISLVTDLYWTRTTYVASSARNAAEYGSLVDYATFVTDLDEHMRWAYLVGGALGYYQEPGGTYANVEATTALLEKGFRLNPDNLILRGMLTYAHAVYRHDAISASRVASAPGKTLPHLQRFASRMMAASGRFEVAREYVKSVLATETDELTRKMYAQRLLEIDLEEVLSRVDLAVVSWRARNEGKSPTSIEELALDFIPVDPFGGEIILGVDGKAVSTVRERLSNITIE
jgi:hypothetical protein